MQCSAPASKLVHNGQPSGLRILRGLKVSMCLCRAGHGASTTNSMACLAVTSLDCTAGTLHHRYDLDLCMSALHVMSMLLSL